MSEVPAEPGSGHADGGVSFLFLPVPEIKPGNGGAGENISMVLNLPNTTFSFTWRVHKMSLLVSTLSSSGCEIITIKFMTTPKQRATTLQEKFGFADEDLKTPQHDVIMMWIDQQAEELIQEYYAIPSVWKKETIDRVRGEAETIARTKFGMLPWAGLGEPPSRKIIVQKKYWERPIVTSKGFAVGFADMEIIVAVPERLSYAYATPSVGRKSEKSDWPEWCVEWSKESVIFEAKTSIRSVGEVIRQIRLYQEYKKGHYIVVSSDDKFAGVLRNQEIQFVKFEPVQKL